MSAIEKALGPDDHCEQVILESPADSWNEKQVSAGQGLPNPLQTMRALLASFLIAGPLGTYQESCPLGVLELSTKLQGTAR